jgi:hypothetical protein
MRFRLGLLAGAAIGYLQGTKAGRERYEQIRQQWQKARRTQPAQRLSGEFEHAAERASHSIGQAANRGVDKVRGIIRRGEKGGGETAATGGDGGPVTTMGAPIASPLAGPRDDTPLAPPVSDTPFRPDAPLTEPTNEPVDTPVTEPVTDVPSAGSDRDEAVTTGSTTPTTTGGPETGGPASAEQEDRNR